MHSLSHFMSVILQYVLVAQLHMCATLFPKMKLYTFAAVLSCLSIGHCTELCAPTSKMDISEDFDIAGEGDQEDSVACQQLVQVDKPSSKATCIRSRGSFGKEPPTACFLCEQPALSASKLWS